MSANKSLERRKRQMTLNIEKCKRVAKRKNDKPLGKYEIINPKESEKKRSFFS